MLELAASLAISSARAVLPVSLAPRAHQHVPPLKLEPARRKLIWRRYIPASITPFSLAASVSHPIWSRRYTSGIASALPGSARKRKS